MRIISEINRRKSYKVVIKSDYDEVIEVTNISGILANDVDEVINAFAHCNLMATSVGKMQLKKFFQLLSGELKNELVFNQIIPLISF